MHWIQNELKHENKINTEQFKTILIGFHINLITVINIRSILKLFKLLLFYKIIYNIYKKNQIPLTKYILKTLINWWNMLVKVIDWLVNWTSLCFTFNRNILFYLYSYVVDTFS